jgi:hypothetical protein
VPFPNEPSRGAKDTGASRAWKLLASPDCLHDLTPFTRQLANEHSLKAFNSPSSNQEQQQITDWLKARVQIPMIQLNRIFVNHLAKYSHVLNSTFFISQRLTYH